MKRVLIACADKELQKQMTLTAREQGAFCTEVSSSSSARRAADSLLFDLIMIRAPLKDEFGRELAIKLSENTYSEIIFICPQDIAPEISGIMESRGISVLPSGCSRQEMLESIRRSFEAAERVKSFHISEKKIQTRSEEIKTVNRAKKILIKQKGLTEPQAHRFIEKKAMDSRKTRLEISVGILKAAAHKDRL